MTSAVQAAVAARVPGAAGLGLLVPPSARLLPAVALADPGWVGERVAALGVRHRSDDARALATVWWYSASAVLVTPVLAGLVTGRPLSARLADTGVAVLAGGLPVAAVSAAGARPGDAGGQLRGTLDAVVAAVAAVGGLRPRPLWAVAADSLATRLLALGRALGDVAAATAVAAPLAAAVGPPLPVPGYVDVDGVRFVRRVSCCLLYRLPGEPLCTSCPRRPPGQRQVLLEDAVERGR